MAILNKLPDFHKENLGSALLLHERGDVRGVYEVFARIERRGEATLTQIINFAVGANKEFKPLRHYLRSGGVKPPSVRLGAVR